MTDKMQLRTRVKICGLTSIEDAQTVVEAGADAIGLVFYEPSPRHVEIEQAAQIAKNIPAFVSKTALFVNPDVSYVEQVLAAVDIDLLQFHGDETVEFCEQFDKPYIKAVRMQQNTDLEAIAKTYSSASGLLLDAYVPGIPGGTGEKFNWAWIPNDLSLKVILAGGLNAENVQQAIVAAQPWAVDVSGGVELKKGVKSSEKVYQFMKTVIGTL